MSPRFVFDCKYVFLGIFHNSKHIGNIKFDSINNKKSTSFLGILIGDKEWRNKSVGSEVIKICAEKFYQDFGIRKIFLVVDKKNKIAINSYKKSNFVIEKSKETILHGPLDWRHFNYVGYKNVSNYIIENI